MVEIDRDFLEKLIIKGILSDKTYLILTTSAFLTEYFNNTSVCKVFDVVDGYFEQYKNIPDREVIINSVNERDRQNVKDLMEDIDSIDYDVAGNMDHLITETNTYLKEQAIKNSIVKAVDIVESNGQTENIKNLIEDALCKDLKVDLGLQYFRDLGRRLRRIFETTEIRIPTFYPQFDEFINGGFPPLTLSVIIARIHGFKCLDGSVKIKIKNNEKEQNISIGKFFEKLETMNKHIVDEDIAKEVKKVDGYEVYTDVGWIPINYIIKTIPLKKLIVLFESGIEIECADKHVFIGHNNKEIFAINLKEGDEIKSKDGFEIVFDVFETDEYIEMYDLSLENHHLFYSNGILSHNSNTMANFAARQVLRGKNVALLSLEMSQDMFAQRFDSIYSFLDINRMYLGANRRHLMDKLSHTRATENRGELYIKHYPTGIATVRDFRKYLRELSMRDANIDILYVDYINLMKPELSGNSDLYNRVKGIAEELRALSFEFEIPVVSVSQLNREGSFVGFEELDFNYIAESMGLPATCDFLSIYGLDEEQLVYKSEVHYKIVKNRLGGRVGEVGKMYFDSRNLRMYDESELDNWIEDANISGDEREMAPEPQPQRNNARRRRR